MSEIKTISVKKLDFWNSLCAEGIKPPTNKSSYVENVQKHLWKMLGIGRQECSEATSTFIDKQAVNFCKSAMHAWGKSARKYERMPQQPFLLGDIIVEVEPVAELLGPDRSRQKGPYKSFQEKSRSGQDKAIAAVKNHNEPEAILKAAPAAASALGKPQLATAIRMMEKQPDVLPAMAISGMKDDSMYTLFRNKMIMLDEMTQ